jgi:hypothetical protein
MKRTKGVEPKSSYFKINQELINEGSDASSVAENNDQAPINGNQAPINGNQAPINENGGALFSAENSDDSYITARSHVSEEFKTARSYKEVDPAAAAAAAQKIIRGFKSYKNETYINDLLSRQKTPKELEPSSQTTRKDYFHSRQEIVNKLEPKKHLKIISIQNRKY